MVIVRNRNIILILAMLFFSDLHCQFFALYQKPSSNQFYSILNSSNSGDFKVVNLRQSNMSGSFVSKNQLLTYSVTGQIIDSTSFYKNYFPINLPISFFNRQFWSCAYNDSLNTSSTKIYPRIIELNSNYKCISSLDLSSLSPDDELPSNLACSADYLYVAINNLNTQSTKIIRFNSTMQRKDSILFNGVGQVLEMNVAANKIFLTTSLFPTSNPKYLAQKVVLDTNLVLLEVLDLDSFATVNPGCLANVGILPIGAKVIPISSTKCFVTGYSSVPYNSACDSRFKIVTALLDNNNTIVSKNICGSATKNTMFMDNTNFVAVKYNFIVTAGNTNHDPQSTLYLQTQKGEIYLNKLDTNGVLLWEKFYGGDMYYRPMSTSILPDSSILVSGIRYNSENPIYLNIPESFILKVKPDGTLLTVGIKSISDSRYFQVKCYPNPTKGIIKFEVPFQDNYALSISDVSGKFIKSFSSYSNFLEIDVSEFPQGLYFYSINTNQFITTGKFIIGTD